MFLWEKLAIFASSLLTSTASADFCGTAPPEAFLFALALAAISDPKRIAKVVRM